MSTFYFKFLRVILGLHIFALKHGASYMVNNNPYHHRVFLDPQNKYQLEWEVDWTEKRIQFEICVETRGYVGFGLASKGKMTGADIVIGGVFPNGTSYFSDRHAVANQLPELDSSQDWELLKAWEDETRTYLRFSRAFDTCDPQDYPITENKISLIWAFGERDSEITYHYRNRGEYPVYLLHPDYTPPPDNGVPTSTQSISNYKLWTVRTRTQIRAADTTYWCTMHQAPKLPRKHHFVGFSVRFADSLSQRHVHHLILHRCIAPPGRSASQMFASYVNHPGQLCFSVKAPIGPMPTEYCTQFVFAWGVGGRPFFYPPHVGTPFAESHEEYYLLQVHYDNPQLQSNINVDLSMDMHYTSDLRPNEGGLMFFRHESPGLTPSLLVPPMTPEHTVYGLCGRQCTREILPPEGIKVFGTLLHSHNTGVRMRLQHFRGGRELPWVEADDNFDFNFQQGRPVNREVRILPGDSLVARCTYDNTALNGSTVVGGFSSRQEMCNMVVHYYNRIENFIQCSSQIESEAGRRRFLGIGNVTWSAEELEWIAQEPVHLRGMKATEVSDTQVEWNFRRRQEYQRWVLREPQVNRCPQELYSLPEGYRRGNNHWAENDEDPSRRLVAYPTGASAYVPPARQCGLR